MEIKENNDNIVNKLYKDLANLTLEERKEESLMEKKEEDPVAAAKCTPILGGQVSTQSRPSGMARNMTLGLTTTTSTGSTTTSTPPSTRSTSTPMNPKIVHEENCSCPYCYVRSRNKQR